MRTTLLTVTLAALAAVASAQTTPVPPARTAPGQAAERAPLDLAGIRALVARARTVYPRNAWHIDKELWRAAADAAEALVTRDPRNLAALALRA